MHTANQLMLSIRSKAARWQRGARASSAQASQADAATADQQPRQDQAQAPPVATAPVEQQQQQQQQLMLPYPMITQPQEGVTHEDYVGGAQPPQSLAPPTAVQEELEALRRTELSCDAAIRSARERAMALTRRSTTEALAGNLKRGRQLLSTAYAATQALELFQQQQAAAQALPAAAATPAAAQQQQEPAQPAAAATLVAAQQAAAPAQALPV